jgi:hypothetical protein
MGCSSEFIKVVLKFSFEEAKMKILKELSEFLKVCGFVTTRMGY